MTYNVQNRIKLRDLQLDENTFIDVNGIINQAYVFYIYCYRNGLVPNAAMIEYEMQWQQKYKGHFRHPFEKEVYRDACKALDLLIIAGDWKPAWKKDSGNYVKRFVTDELGRNLEMVKNPPHLGLRTKETRSR